MADQESSSVEMPKNLQVALMILLVLVLFVLGIDFLIQFRSDNNLMKAGAGIILLYIDAIILFNKKALKFPDFSI